MSSKFSLFIFFIFFSMFCQSPVFSQVKGLSDIDLQNMMQENSLKQFSNDKILSGETTPVGNTVNPDFYYVGPGDVLTIEVLSSLGGPQPVVVSPENTLVIPRIGEIDVTGKTLTETRKLIIDQLNKRNPSSLVFVVFQQPRTVVVTLKGNVEYPGTYTFPATYSVSTALKVASKLSESSNNNGLFHKEDVFARSKNIELEKEFAAAGMPLALPYSSRNITVFHKDGTSQTADLEKAQVMSDPVYDPYLREGDEILVPYDDKTDKSFISISGAVARPAIASYKAGDKASFLLKLGFRLNDDADRDNIYLLMPGNSERIKITVDAENNITGNDIVLKPGSSMVVGKMKSESLADQGVVAISGNVNSPGAYVIIPYKTRLKEAIEMAGGFTDKAYLPLAYILRREINKTEKLSFENELYKKLQYSDLTMQDTTRLTIDLKLKKPIVACDFVAAFENNSAGDNVLLEDGDMIVIPSNPRTVYVFGQVNKPGLIAFEEGKTMDWYLERAGGIAAGGKPGRARIIRGRTKTWEEGDEKDTFVYAGDEIYVPRKPDDPPGTEMQTYALILSVGGLLLSAIFQTLYYLK